MSTMTLTPKPQLHTPEPEAPKSSRRSSRRAGLLAPELVEEALKQSFVMLRPDIQWKNPVMFVVEIGTVLTVLFTIAAVAGATGPTAPGYIMFLCELDF